MTPNEQVPPTEEWTSFFARCSPSTDLAGLAVLRPAETSLRLLEIPTPRVMPRLRARGKPMVGFRLRGDIRRRRRGIRNDFLRQGRIGRARPPPRHEFPPQLLVFTPQRIALRFQFANLRRQRRHDGFCGCRRCNRFNRRIRHHHATEQVRTHEQRNAPATEAAAPSVFQSAEHRHDHCSFVGLRLYHKTSSPSH